MLIFVFCNPGIRTTSGQKVTLEALRGYATAAKAVGLTTPVAVKVVFSYELQLDGVDFKGITRKIQSLVGEDLKVRYDLAPKPYVRPEAPTPKAEPKPRGKRAPKAVA